MRIYIYYIVRYMIVFRASGIQCCIIYNIEQKNRATRQQYNSIPTKYNALSNLP